MEFTYNASAVAGGGVIQKLDGSYVIVPSLAPVALSPTGGEGVTIEKNYSSPEVSFSLAETRVFGREVAPGVFTTQTDVYMTNLRVLDVLTIAMLRATVTSTRTINSPGDDDHAFELDASYNGVVVHDPVLRTAHAVAPKIDVAMKSVRRYNHLKELLTSAPGVSSINANDGTQLIPCADKAKLLERFNAQRPSDLIDALDARLPVLGSLIDAVDDEVPSVNGRGPVRRNHKLYIPGVGTVRFGELMLKPGRRRVNLLRIEFAKNELLSLMNDEHAQADEEAPELYAGGSLTMASVEGNGSPLHP